MADTAVHDVLLHEVLHGAVSPADPPSTKDFSRTLKLPAGKRKGQLYDPDSDPNQRYLLEQIDSGYWTRFAVCAPPQIGGKTQTVILPPTLRGVIRLRDPVGYGLPTLDALDKAWLEKLKPSIEKSGYGHYLPLKGPGSKGGRGKVVNFHDPVTGDELGSLVFMTGGAFGNTVKIVVVDDVDKFRKGEGPDREAVEDIFHRADSYREDARRIAVGTIEYDVGSLILALIEDSTDTRPHPSCPHCKLHQRLVWTNVVCSYESDASAMDTARYRCDGCAMLWDEDDRQRALENVLFVHRGQSIESGAVIGPSSQSRTLGLTWGGLDSTLAHLGELCVEYRNAQLSVERGDHSSMRKFVRYRECRPYTADREEMEAGVELTWQNLLARSAASRWGVAIHTTDKTTEMAGHTYSRHATEPPNDAIFASAGVDVQNNRIYAEMSAYSLDGSSFDIAWEYQFARADHTPWDQGELFALLDAVDLWLHRMSGTLPLAIIGLDVGDFTKDLMPWLVGKRGSVWHATKGGSGNLKDEPGDIDGLVHPRDGLFMLNTENLRDLLHAAYRRPSGQAGAIHLPAGLSNNATNTAYLKHLVAEMSVIDPKTRKKRVRRGPGRWDWQDARRITHAMALWHLRKVKHMKPKTATADRRRDRDGDWDVAVGGW